MIQAFVQSRLWLACHSKKYLLSHKLMAVFTIAFFIFNTNLYADKHFNSANIYLSQNLLAHIKTIPTQPSQLVTINSITNHLLSGWIFDKTVGNVDCYHLIADCNGAAAVFLKFQNNNKFDVKISWKELFTTRQVSSKSEGIKGEKKLILPPGETSSTSCTATINKECIILPQQAIPAYKADILQFEFKDITVKPAQ